MGEPVTVHNVNTRQGDTKHPATFSTPIMAAVRTILDNHLPPVAGRQHRVLDPFAGVGTIHDLRYDGFDTVGVELEPEWAAKSPHTVCGDSRDLTATLTRAGQTPLFDAIVTSPAYGNRMADNYAGDAVGSKRFTYRIALGRPLTSGNSGSLQWGAAYRGLHEAVWRQCTEVLAPGGLFVLNVSNHVRAGKVMPVVEWHLGILFDLGFQLEDVQAVTTRRMRFGANGEARTPNEKVATLRWRPS